VVDAKPRPERRSVRPSRLGLAVLAVGLALTGVLSWVCFEVNTHNESRLLDLQVKQTAALLQVVLPSIQTPLASAVEIAATGNGDRAAFRTYMNDYLGPKGTFVSASLYRLSPGPPRLVTTAGVPPLLAQTPGATARVLAKAATTMKLTISGPITGDPYRVGYAFVAARSGPDYAVYAESALPDGRKAPLDPASAFGNLRFALYLGASVSPDTLLESNVDSLPVRGRTSKVVVPFGGSELTLVARSSVHLGGTLLGLLWWVVALAGTVLTVVAALTAERLVHRSRAAERLTAEVQTLLGEQRNLAETLQHALLPKAVPLIDGMELAARYIPGVNGVEIGGDWYDVIPLTRDRFFFAVGDVSGRGVEAGTVMASLLFAIRGFVSEGHSPDAVLTSLTRVLRIDREGHFATVVCGVADVARHEVTLANAGHLPLLLVSGERSEFVASPVGPPIGVTTDYRYTATTVPVPPGATLLAYTDGLVERRGETVDDGLRRLHESAVTARAGDGSVVTTVLTDLAADRGDDDTAILELRWLT
jgi:serine phosphatase RsbU (regulator of sigma subunit)